MTIYLALGRIEKGKFIESPLGRVAVSRFALIHISKHRVVFSNELTLSWEVRKSIVAPSHVAVFRSRMALRPVYVFRQVNPPEGRLERANVIEIPAGSFMMVGTLDDGQNEAIHRTRDT